MRHATRSDIGLKCDRAVNTKPQPQLRWWHLIWVAGCSLLGIVGVIALAWAFTVQFMLAFP